MEKLTSRIAEKLAARPSVTLFEPELSTIWPIHSAVLDERKEAIRAYAETHGWKATIIDPGIRVTFRKQDP